MTVRASSATTVTVGPRDGPARKSAAAVTDEYNITSWEALDSAEAATLPERLWNATPSSSPLLKWGLGRDKSSFEDFLLARSLKGPTASGTITDVHKWASLKTKLSNRFFILLLPKDDEVHPSTELSSRTLIDREFPAFLMVCDAIEALGRGETPVAVDEGVHFGSTTGIGSQSKAEHDVARKFFDISQPDSAKPTWIMNKLNKLDGFHDAPGISVPYIYPLTVTCFRCDDRLKPRPGAGAAVYFSILRLLPNRSTISRLLGP
jgi:hypothetical protein